jgi:tetratricopeptide (TPR) repeat protein
MRVGPQRLLSAVLAGLAAVAACSAPPAKPLPDGAEAWSLDGRALYPPALPDAVRAPAEAELAAARALYERGPHVRDSAIWYGRRLGYLGRFRAAIEVYTANLRDHPDDPRLLRHRGHRWITVREFAAAESDLARAARCAAPLPIEVEADGQPVAGRPPHSTLQYNIHYHLGLARWLQGDFAGAEAAWRECLRVAQNDESRVAVSHWLWCACTRQGDDERAAAVVAPIHAAMDVVENTAYLELCLLYRGDRSLEQLRQGEGSSGAALAFGRAHWQLVRGDRASAFAELGALAANQVWPAFGVIAAEAELRRR